MLYKLDISRSVNMAEDSTVLKEIVKAKENIKHKFNILKSGEADFKSLVSQTFKPIIEPLNKIQINQQHDIQLNEKQQQQNELIYEDLEIEKWYKSSDKDKTYGPKKTFRGIVYLGNKEVKFIDNNLIIEDTSYPLSTGVIQLLFSKNPYRYTKQDLSVYKNILIHSSAHLTNDGSKIKIGGKKYKNIICKLFSSGMGMKLQKYNLVYWNDPNELVDRLRLLLASQAAGNTGVNNEILSIYEELHEAGLIKRIPNV